MTERSIHYGSRLWAFAPELGWRRNRTLVSLDPDSLLPDGILPHVLLIRPPPDDRYVFLLESMEELSRVEIVRNDPEVSSASDLLGKMRREACARIDLHFGLVSHMLQVLLYQLGRAR